MEATVDAIFYRLTESVLLLSDRLGGSRNEAMRLIRRLQTIQFAVVDDQRRAIRDPAIRHWLSELRDVLYDAEDSIDDLIAKSESKDAFAGTIQAISQKLNSNSKKRLTLRPIADEDAASSDPQVSRFLPNLETIYGSEKEARAIVELLLKGNKLDLITGIVGVGGIGKTTLAQMIYSDEAVVSFFEIRIWICLSSNLSQAQLLKQIIASTEKNDDQISSVVELMRVVTSLFSEKRFLLVLDDVQHWDVWEGLLKTAVRNRSDYSRILTTCRNEGVPMKMGAVHIHRMKPLSIQDGWLMLRHLLFGSQEVEEIEELQDVGQKIVRKCNGLPLLIKAAAGLLEREGRSKQAWESLLQNLEWSHNEVEGIASAQYSSYEVLPPLMKQCFLYFSLFPEDYEFDSWNLMQLWMAEGFAAIDKELPMEDVITDLYRELIRRSILQITYDDYDEQRCKMHSLLQGLARSMGHEYYISDYVQYIGMIAPSTMHHHRHLSIIGQELDSVTHAIKNHKCLRTLILSHNPLLEAILDDIFTNLKLLRVLDLSHTGIKKMPHSIGQLMLLKHLNLSFTRITELPESIGKLQNLQTLNIDFCEFLHNLPESIIVLSSLRHLMMRNTKLHDLPRNFRELDNLCMLNGFIAGNRRRSYLKELGRLKQLRHLDIHKLEMVRSDVAAKAADIGSKSQLEQLKLSCTSSSNSHHFEEDEIKRIEEVFEELSPPGCLSRLIIESYFGRKWPIWMTAYLHELHYLKLKKCVLCKHIPDLSLLPKLKVFHISGLSAVTFFSPELFFGGTFPCLEDLTMEDMFNMEEWCGLQEGSLPCLRKLTIINCPKLRALPEDLQHTALLDELEIRGADSLTAIENLSSLTDMKIADNCTLKSIRSLPMLQRLTIENCPVLKDIQGIDNLKYLQLEDVGTDILPDWITSIRDLNRLVLIGSINLLRRCYNDHEEWPKIEHIGYVEAKSYDGSTFVSYTKIPFSFHSNIQFVT